MTLSSTAGKLRPAPDDRAGPKHSVPGEPEATDLERVYVWDLVVRLTHWVLVLSVFVLAATGIYIGKPFLAAAPHGILLTATVKVVHFYTAIVFSLTLLLRLAWMFAGPPRARWNQFVPTTAGRLREGLRMMRFYLFIDSDPPLVIGHNPVAGLAYLAVFALCALMIATGLALHAVDARLSYMQVFDVLLPIFGGPQSARYLHHIGMWLILGFFAHHIWAAILVSRAERNGLIDSMFSGYKFLPPGWRKHER